MKKGAHWPFVIIALLVANAGVGAALVFLSMKASPDLVTEDYYQEAAQWDETMQQQRANQSLGWSIDATLAALPSGASEVSLLIVDRDANAVVADSVEAVLFHRGFPKHKYRVRFVARDGGVYVGSLRSTKSGVWEVEYTIRRKGQVFAASTITTLEQVL